MDCMVARRGVWTSPSVAMAQLRICCRGTGGRAKPGGSGAGCKGQQGKPAEQGPLEVSGEGSSFCRVPKFSPRCPVVGGWSCSKAELPMCSCWLCLPSPCSPAGAFSGLRKKWCPLLKCPLRHC